MSDFLLLVLCKNNVCKVGLPPSDYCDNFNNRATVCGEIDNARLVAYSPNGQLYAICGQDLYRGPVPTNSTKNWFSEAQQVGKSDWGQFKFILFHPNGQLYAATHKGELFEGPAPDNVHESWLYRKAKKVGATGWNSFYALFFDQNGVLHAVSSSKFLKRHPPTTADEPWAQTSTVIGLGVLWSRLTHFMGFDPLGNLWCVSKEDGSVFMGPPPTHAQYDWIKGAEKLGTAYHNYKIMLFVRDRTIKAITSLEFMADSSKILSVSPEVVAEQVYDNKGSSVGLNSTFTVSKTYEATSSFSQDHGFSVDANFELSIETGIPIIASGSLNFGIDFSTTHTWSFTKNNTTKVEFSNQFHFQVPPGKAVRQTALVQKANAEMPYRAKIRTLFGNETTISGVWKGVCYFNLHVKQVDV